MNRAHTVNVMTDTEFSHLQVCGTCDSWCIGYVHQYCDLKVPEDRRDESGVRDWDLPDHAVRGPHDTCQTWSEW
jgi:hypothetical protein